MLRPAELKLPDDELVAVLRKRTSKIASNQDAEEAHRELAFMFELDTQVRKGGFAQYFFNTSGPNAVDAWFAADVIDEATSELLSQAIARLGLEFGVDLDLHRLLAEGGGDAVVKAEAQLLLIFEEAHKASSDLKEAFVAFAKRLDGDKQGLPGFGKLNRLYVEEVDIDTAVVEHVRAEPEPFLRK